MSPRPVAHRDFDPDVHSIADVARWVGVEPTYSEILNRHLSPSERAQFVRPTDGLDLRVVLEGYGFPVEDDDEDSLAQRIVDDYHAKRNGTTEGRCWSDQRQSWDAEADAEIARMYEDPSLYAGWDDPELEPGPPYRVVYADPGWQYRNRKTGGSHKSGAAQQYTVMPPGEIGALPVRRSLVHPEGTALFMWCTTPMKPEAFEVWRAWGATYRTSLYWIKDDFDEVRREVVNGRLGMGWWFRGQVEECWVGTWGEVKAFRCQERNYVFAKAEGHSRKPQKVRALIQRATADLGGPRIELFSRDLVQGWDHWGDEVFTPVRLVDGRFVRR